MRASIRSRAARWSVLAAIGIGLGAVIQFLSQRSGRPDNRGLWHGNLGTPLQVEARASDGAWQFSYSGADGILGTDDDPVSGSHLTLPAGANVILQLRSDDYTYVFSCPALRLKEIAVPDLEFSIAFRVDHRGEYDLVMDPMCGFRLPPGETMGTLSLGSESDFCRWLRKRPRSH